MGGCVAQMGSILASRPAAPDLKPDSADIFFSLLLGFVNSIEIEPI